MDDFIGLIPAAGQAKRMRGLPKFLLPTRAGFLLRRMFNMMSTSCTPYVLGGPHTERHINGYIKPRNTVSLLTQSATMNDTLIRTRRAILNNYGHKHSPVLLGMPDTYIEDIDAFSKLRACIRAGADVAVGHFDTRPEQRGGLGMLSIEGDRITHCWDKPDFECYLTRAWGVMAWRPEAWAFINPDEPHCGYMINPAIQHGLDVRPVALEGRYWDCGTIEEYSDMLAVTVLGREHVSLPVAGGG